MDLSVCGCKKKASPTENILPAHFGYFRYTFKRRIASGGFGVVSLVQDRNTKEKCARKKIKLNKNAQVAPVNKEIAFLHNADHPNIIKLRNIYVQPGTQNEFDIKEVCLVMEYMPYTLKYLIPRKHIPIYTHTISFIVYQVLNGLAHLHRSEIIHKDIKPENIGADNKFNIKLLDFGISQLAKGTLNFHGSHIYKAPELEDEKNLSVKADIWPVGIIMTDLVRRKLYNFVGEKINTVRKLKSDQFNWEQALGDQKFPPIGPNATDPEISAQNARHLMQHMLQIDPNQRISALQALNHPFLSVWRTEEEEKDCSTFRVEHDLCKCEKTGEWSKKLLVEKIHEIAEELNR